MPPAPPVQHLAPTPRQRVQTLPRSAPAASAAFAGSTAIGAGAVTTAPNQMMFGAASNTYVAPGITSAASLAAQSGPTNFVTSDASGHLAVSNFSPQTITNLSNSVASLNQSVASLQNGVSRAFEGTAIAIAM